MVLFIISTCLLVISLVLLLLGINKDWNDLTFVFIISLIMASGLGMMISAGLDNSSTKVIEYPTSEYDFKIKVVEFEEHRDTILVVIPKER